MPPFLTNVNKPIRPIVIIYKQRLQQQLQPPTATFLFLALQLLYIYYYLS